LCAESLLLPLLLFSFLLGVHIAGSYYGAGDMIVKAASGDAGALRNILFAGDDWGSVPRIWQGMFDGMMDSIFEEWDDAPVDLPRAAGGAF
jgi:hypothetical protein